MAIDRANSPFFDRLFSSGNQLVSDQMGPGGVQSLFPLAGGLQQTGQNFLGSLGGVGQNLGQFIGPGFTGAQIGALGNQLGQFFNEQLLPGIQTGATRAGQTGGTRQGVAQGIGMQGVLDAFGEGAAGILANDIQRRQNAAIAQGGLQTGAAGTGLGALSGLFDLGLAPFLAQFAPLQAQAGLLGSQPVFQEQSSSQQAISGINTGLNALNTFFGPPSVAAGPNGGISTSGGGIFR